VFEVETLEGGETGLKVLAVLDPTKSPFSNGSLNHCDDNGRPVLVGFVSCVPIADEDMVDVSLVGTSFETKKVMPVSSS
jgi:hypothetical protein